MPPHAGTMGSQPQQAGLVSCWHAGRSLLLTSKSYPRPKLRKARRFERRQARMAGSVEQAVLTIVSYSERLPFQSYMKTRPMVRIALGRLVTFVGGRR